MTQTAQTPTERLQLLTEFNPALVYLYEASTSEVGKKGSDRLEDTFIDMTKQAVNMLDGYLHVQQYLLPYLRAIKAGTIAFSNDEFLGQLKELHRQFTQQLFVTRPERSGAYTLEAVARWHDSQIMLTFSRMVLGEIADDDFVRHLYTEYQIPKATTRQFIAIMKPILMDASEDLHADWIRYRIEANKTTEHLKALPPQVLAVVQIELSLARLCFFYYLPGKLTEKQKAVIRQIVLPTRLPHLMPAAMEEFAVWFGAAFVAVDQTDLHKVAEFVGETFYRLTSIHPFANGNGRVATGLLSALLCALGYPSIVLRQSSDADTAYTDAMAAIETDRGPLIRLIEQRVQLTKKASFVDEIQRELFLQRLQILEVFEKLLAHGYDINNLCLQGKLPIYLRQHFVATHDRLEVERLQAGEFLSLGRQELARLDAQAEKMKAELDAAADDVVVVAPVVMPAAAGGAGRDSTTRTAGPLGLFAEPSLSAVAALRVVLQEKRAVGQWHYRNKGGEEKIWIRGLTELAWNKLCMELSAASFVIKASGKVDGKHEYMIQIDPAVAPCLKR